MFLKKNFKKLSFLVYGLGITGQSVVSYFKKNNFQNYEVWDDSKKNLYKKKRSKNLLKTLNDVNYIILSPGVSFKNLKNKISLRKFENKIITDLDIIYLFKKFSRSIVVTGTNGKSTTCKILAHLLKKNKFKFALGGNIGKPVLSLKLKKGDWLIIEASSFQLSHSKFISPDYALLLNIANDHLDWHGNMNNYTNSKFKIFKNQSKKQFSFLNKKLITTYHKKKLLGKLIIPNLNNYKRIKPRINNAHLALNVNDENMSFALSLSRILRINEKSFINSFKTFKGLPHRYEIFLKKKNCIFINDSKATSYESTKFALQNSRNIYWIVGGLHKKNDKIILEGLKKNIVKSYIIGKNTNFFKNQVKKKLNFFVAGNLKKSLKEIFKDIKLFNKENNTILLSPASASYDQFLNFEKRGEEFKKICKSYARKYF